MFHRFLLHRVLLTGSVALTFLLGTLVLAAPAQAAEICSTDTAGTQAYAECVARGGDTSSRVTVQDQGLTPAPPVESSSTGTEIWSLAVAGLVGAGLAIGGAFGVSRLGSRQSATAH